MILPKGINIHRCAANMLPIRFDAQRNAPFGKNSPIFSYPFERTRESLQQLKADTDADVWNDTTPRYVNPGTGGSPVHTMATFKKCLSTSLKGKP